MKKQQCMFKLFSMINPSSSTSTTSFNNVRLRPFCSTTTTTNMNLFAPPTIALPVNTTFQWEKLKPLLEKKLPLLIVPYDYVTKQKYFKSPHTSLDGGFISSGTIGFIPLFVHDEYQLTINNKEKKKKQLQEVTVYAKHLSRIDNQRICGSSEGWLVTIHMNGGIQLFNPLTKLRIDLPPLIVPAQSPGRLCYLTDLNIIDEPPYYISGSHRFREVFISKAVTNTTSDTRANQALMVVVVVIIYSKLDRLAFCSTSLSLSTGNRIRNRIGNRIGNHEPAAKKWIEIRAGRNDCRKCWDDVTFYKGKFYAVGSFGNVGVVKGLGGSSPPFMQCIIDGPEAAEPDLLVNYLVESPSSSSSSGGDHGDLLMVMRAIKKVEETEEKEQVLEENFEHPYRTIGFKVWKLDLNGPSWEKVTDLGEDVSLFIGYNQSFSISASKFPGCRGNCIYFTDNTQMDIIYPTGGHDTGVYNLLDGSFEKFYEISSSRPLFMHPPVWYVPNVSGHRSMP